MRGISSARSVRAAPQRSSRALTANVDLAHALAEVSKFQRPLDAGAPKDGGGAGAPKSPHGGEHFDPNDLPH